MNAVRAIAPFHHRTIPVVRWVIGRSSMRSSSKRSTPARHLGRWVLVLLVLMGAAGAASVTAGARPKSPPADGQSIFRFDTFGDEQFWTDALQLHTVIRSSVSPLAALAVGLKVDAAALPPDFLATHDLNDPATTVELLRHNAVLGVVGKVV